MADQSEATVTERTEDALETISREQLLTLAREKIK